MPRCSNGRIGWGLGAAIALVLAGCPSDEVSSVVVASRPTQAAPPGGAASSGTPVSRSPQGQIAGNLLPAASPSPSPAPAPTPTPTLAPLVAPVPVGTASVAPQPTSTPFNPIGPSIPIR